MFRHSIRIAIACILAFVGLACQNRFGPSSFSGPGNTPPVTISGSYCTVWNQWAWSSNGTPPINLVCLQPNGQWENTAGFPEPQAGQSKYSYWGFPSLTKAADGDLLMTYMRYIYPTPFNEEYVMTRFHQGTGWSQVTSADVNSSGGTLLSTYNQFGGQNFEISGVPYYLWTESTQGMVSTPNGASAWTQIPVAPALGNMFRHPEVTPSTLGNYVYLNYGEPTPTVWKFDGTNLTQMGTITTNPATQWTLYTSLVEWNGQLAFAYTSCNMPTTQNWATTTAVTEIALYNGTSWNLISTGIQDTPGHDMFKPYLFVTGGNLYVMYDDYTTDGLPTVNNQLSFRLRVKEWNGTSWSQVGTESDSIYYSQRPEYLNDNGTVLVNVVEPAANGTDSQQVVMAWSQGQFSYEGAVLRTFPKELFVMAYRPGAVIKLQ